MFAYVFALCESLCCPSAIGCARCVWSWCFGAPGWLEMLRLEGRLEQWLHNVFALMIPTVCSSYQLRCTGFHNCHRYEITQGLLSFTLPSGRQTTRTPVRKQSDSWSGQTNSLGKKKREREMDVRCRKFIHWEGDSQGWPLGSTEALARVLIVHWDNPVTPRRALSLQSNVPAQPQHIIEGAGDGGSDKMSSVLGYTMWCECIFSSCGGEVWGYECVYVCRFMCAHHAVYYVHTGHGKLFTPHTFLRGPPWK